MSGPVVVGYADNGRGRVAVRAAAAHACLTGGRLVVVRSTDAYDAGSNVTTQPTELAEIAEARGIETEFRLVSSDNDVAQALLAVADQVHAALLVIGLRRRSPVGKLFLGSIAQRILLGANCPVLAVKVDPSESD